MTTAGRWDPLGELRTVQKRMNRLFEGALGKTDFDTQEEVDTWTPVCDVYESAEALEICLELPGLSQERIDVQIDGNDLVVSGEREVDQEQPGERFHRVERPYGKFSRRFHLPTTVDRESVKASYTDGILRVTLATREGSEARSIQVAIE